MHTHVLGQELSNQHRPLSVRDLAQYLHDHKFGHEAGKQPDVNELVRVIDDIENGRVLPFDDALLSSFIQLAAGYLSDGDALKQNLILDRLAWAASQDIMRELLG